VIRVLVSKERFQQFQEVNSAKGCQYRNEVADRGRLTSCIEQRESLRVAFVWRSRIGAAANHRHRYPPLET
jgi:hypothetical protein